MKKLLLLSIFFYFLLLHFEFANAQVPSYVPTSGLVAYYPFNGNANDVSGNGNNGVVNGATLTTDRNGNPNSGFSFNGSNSYISLNVSGGLLLDSGTISTWVKILSYPSSQSLIFGQSAGTPQLVIRPNGKIRIQKNTTFNYLDYLESNMTLNIGNWYHIIATFSKTRLSITINGLLDNSGIFSNPIYRQCTDLPLQIGGFNYSTSCGGSYSDQYASAIIDDIGFYNRALTQQEITQLYTGQVIPSYVPTNGLVGYWPFNGNANDASGNGNNGTVNGATLTTDRFGNVGKAYSFNGSNNNIVVPNSNSLNNTSFTVSGWVFLPNFNAACCYEFLTKGCDLDENYELLIYSQIDTGAVETAIKFTNGTRSGTGGSGTANNCLLKIASNKWQFISATYDVTTGYLRSYINGMPNCIDLLSRTPKTNTTNLYFGSDPCTGRFLFGSMDDIAIYNRALSQSEITQLYTSSAPCIANITTPDTTICKGSSVTLNAAAVTPASATDINGNTYPSVNIGSQTWMQKNLNVSKYKNGDVIPQVTDSATWRNLTTGAWCWYNNDSANYASKGKLYNWYAVNDARGIAPDGWHVPTDGEWNKLIKFLDPLADTVCGGCVQSSLAGGALKQTGTTNWASPNGGATNSSNFNAIAAGIRDGRFLYPTTNAYWWSATANPANLTPAAWSHTVGSSDGNEARISNVKFNGYSVRTVRNTPTYLWSTGATTQSISVSPTTTTTYYVTVSDGVNTCTDSVTVTVSGIVNSDTTICKGAAVTLAAATVNVPSADVSGNAYPSVNIGSQTWSSKNLNTSKYKNGDVIPQVTDATQWAALTTGAWCWYNNDSASYASTYGKLYNWYAVNDSRGLAPDGWHVPSSSEWKRLVKFVDLAADTSCNYSTQCLPSTTAGGMLKANGTDYWLSPNTGATNSTGFTALGSGIRSDNGNFDGIKNYTQFWASEELLIDNRWALFNTIGSQSSSFYFDRYFKTWGRSVRVVRNATTYLWSTGATTQTISVAPTVTTTYYCTINNGYSICTDSVKVIIGATAVPSAPLAIYGATDVCPNIGLDTASGPVNYKCNKVSTATSYLWSVPAGVTLLSGQGDTSINVRFSASFVSGAITVKSVNVCGASTSARSLSVYKRVAATPGVIQKEFYPTSIAAVTNVTGLVSETYRIKKVLYATSYNWYMNRGTNATITHINSPGVDDTAVIVTFVNCFVRDTLSVKSVTPCSVSTARTAILYANTTPATLAGITTVGGDFVVCIGSSKTFTAVANTPTSAQAPVASFRWTVPANSVITSATSDSSSITVSFNTGFTGGSVTAKGVTACGVVGTTAVSAILQYLPPTPLSIGTSTGSYNACINSSVTYTALVGTATTSQAPAVVFRWTKPNNTTITSASTDSSTITLRFNTGYVGGTLSVRGQTRCGTLGGTKSQSLTHTGCAAGTKMSMPVTSETDINSFDLCLYPNPSAGEFKLMIKAPLNKSKAIVKVIDIQGRLMKSFECNANQPTAIGNELKPGVYMVEVRMGNEVKTVRAVRF